MWNTVLFDLDGTLTDSGEGITKSVQYALKKGFSIEVEDLHELDCFVGPPLKEQFMKYACLTEEQGVYAVELYRERYRTIGLFENRPYNGIPELLKKLKEAGITMAVASSKPTLFCRQILEHFELAGYFSVILGSEMDGNRTTKSEVVEEVLRRLGCSDDREEAVLVGDRRYDVEGAKAAGIGSIAVTFGYGSEKELAEAGPDVVCRSADEIADVILDRSDRDGGTFLKNVVDGQENRDFRRTGSVFLCDGSAVYRVWRNVYPFLIDLAVTVLFVMVFGFFTGYENKGFFGFSIKSKYVVAVTCAADLLLIPIYMYLLNKDDSHRRFFGTSSFRIPVKQIFGTFELMAVVLFSLSLNGVLEVFVSMIPISDSVYKQIADIIYGPSVMIQMFAVAMIGPVMEELLFRGICYRRLRDRFGAGRAILISSVVFGAAHGNLTQGVYAMLFGIALAMLYEHYGTLAAPIAAHIVNNANAVIMEAFGSVFSIKLLMLIYSFGIVILAGSTVCIFNKKSRINVV